MPAMWQVEVTVHLTGLRRRDGTVLSLPTAAQDITRTGTAFAVTPDGYLVSAARVITPGATDLAESAYLRYLVATERAHNGSTAAT